MPARRVVTLGALLALTLVASLPHANDAALSTVATVGSARVTTSDVERRLHGIPDFQLRSLGDFPAQIRHQVLAKFIIPDLLYSQEAERQQLQRDPAVRARVDEVLRRAVEFDLRAELERTRPVTDEEVRRYYEANRSRYETPQRIRIWRILVKDEALARKIGADARGTAGLARWAEHARSHSLDSATKMRRGDLGFVRVDGRTDVPRVRVDPALYAAADQVPDGSVVPEPVKEGDAFAVVWRRGSAPAVSRSLEEEAGAIRRILMRNRVHERVDELVARLRRQHLTVLDDSLVDRVSVPPPKFASPAGQASSRRRPAPAPAAPSTGERGLR
jgi:peptidyl-prolyl cis-trans isomerase C